jgi:hypothetical protein
MPGRPRTMFRNVCKSWRQQLILIGDLMALRPERYKGSTVNPSVLHEAWNKAVAAASESAEAIDELLGALSRKLPEPSDAAAIQNEVLGDVCVDCNTVVAPSGQCPRCGYEMERVTTTASRVEDDEVAEGQSEEADEPDEEYLCPDCDAMVPTVLGPCAECGYGQDADNITDVDGGSRVADRR